MTTAKDMLDRLERHYLKAGAPLPGGMLIPEVTHDKHGGRRCDALFVGFTSASGRILVGHEIKVARSDWLHELDQTGKADTWADECHAWYVVAPDETVVRPEEVPHGWGLLLATGARTRLTVKVKATVHADRQPSWTAMRSILSRVDTLRAETVRRQVQVEADKISARYEADWVPKRASDEQLKERNRELHALLERVEAALGVRISDEPRPWDSRSIAPERLAALAPLLVAEGTSRSLEQEIALTSKRVDQIVETWRRAEAAARALLDEVDEVPA
jgi:hypothetical protein